VSCYLAIGATTNKVNDNPAVVSLGSSSFVVAVTGVGNHLVKLCPMQLAQAVDVFIVTNSRRSR
jgi:hypothetical protein